MIHATRPNNVSFCRPRGRWFLATLAVAVFLAPATTPANAADRADSGWTVAKPTAAQDKADNAALEAYVVLGKVDDGAAQLTSVSSSAKSQAKPTEARAAEVRLAARSSSKNNGWRSANNTRNQSQEDSGPAPPLPTQTTPDFLLPTTPVSNNKVEQSKQAEQSKQPQPTTPVKKESQTEAKHEAAKPTTSAGSDEEAVVIVEGHEPAAAEPLPPLTKNMVYLRARLRQVLKSYYRQPLNSGDNDPWEVMHGMLAFGIHSRVLKGSSRGEPITSVGWLCYNKPCKWQTLMYVSPEGKLRAKYGVGLQGHMGQFLAMLAQCHISPDYPIRVEKHDFTVQDLIQAEMDTCYSKTELTFKLIALMHYLESDAQWVNDQGQEWSISRLIQEEMAQPIRGAACGGTHRLAGLSLAARTRVQRGEPLDGEFANAAEYVKKYEDYAFRFQNRDGSLSTSWFKGGGADPDIDRRVKTTGHTLEWLCYSLNDDEMHDVRTTRAVTYLTNLLYSNYDHKWEVGPMCHALHSLILYDERMFQPYDDKLDVAQQGSARSASRSRTMPAWMR
jgi:hypothetical protein